MIPSVIVATASENISPDVIIKGILTVETLPEPLNIIEGVRCFPWHITTKYYEADVQVCALDKKKILPVELAEAAEAEIICFDSKAETKLKAVDQVRTLTEELDTEVRILVCDQCHSESTSPAPSNAEKSATQLGVSTLEAKRWCLKNGFELVELNPAESEVDSDVEDDFPESTGIKRIIEALHACPWSNLVMKEDEPKRSHTEVSPVPNGTSTVNGSSAPCAENIAETIDSMAPDDDDTFGHLFQHLSDMKSKAGNLSPTSRKAYAEKMVIAFWKSMGGDESEIANLDDSDEEN